ncbi:MAG: hypothetical protein KDC49_16995 [Saprospiraceae bacterium]|nr:hypothetical protein [Saprospiraceae bacterium]
MVKGQFFIVAIFYLIILNACQPQKASEFSASVWLSDTLLDTELINEFGADDYGMKAYTMAFLYRGPNTDMDSTTASELQKAHMANINRMAEEGKLVFAGPFMDKDSLRGIYIFNTSLEEAAAMTNTDPAIQAGRLRMELKPFYGSAALEAVNPIHNKIRKVKI